MPIALFALAVAAFGIGTTEFVIMGLLPDVAQDLGVSIPDAGLLVSGYAMGVVIGAPILAVISACWPRRQTLLVLILMFVVGNTLCALAPTYSALMLARILAALCHGAFFGIGSVVAASIVAPERRGQAIALMFMGLTLANVLGVPLGTALGQLAGWRSTFWAVTVIGVGAAFALFRWTPHDLPQGETNLLVEFRALKNRGVQLALLMSVLASTSMFVLFTYITPILQTITEVSSGGVTWLLLLIGVGLTFGSLLGGRLADTRLLPSLVTIMLAVAVIMFTFSQVSQWLIPTAVTLLVWGMLSFALCPMLQFLIVDQATEAPNLSSTLNQSAFNLGNAMGAGLGGLIVSHGCSLSVLPQVGALVILLAAGCVVLMGRTQAPVSIGKMAGEAD